jgi:predicted enzyme related to lactoylglutathione lyase
MKIKLTNVLVDDQDKALKFYTDVLGFVKKTEIPMGEFKWLTVVSKDDDNGVELLLEPMGFPPSRTYQQALKEAKIPYTLFFVDDLEEEYERLKSLGVVFVHPPTDAGPTKIAVLDDTCGNNIQLVEVLWNQRAG